MKTFNELMERDKVCEEIQCFQRELYKSLCSIIDDDEITDKMSALNECVAQFYAVTRQAIGFWSRGKVSGIRFKPKPPKPKSVKLVKKYFTNPPIWHIIKYSPDQPRDENGRWVDSGAIAELMSRIKDGSVSTKIDTKKQNKHIEGTKEYKKAISNGGHPSRLTISAKEQQELVDKYTKEGSAKIFKNGSIRVKFTHSKNIGICCSEDGNMEQKTNKGTIHYSKTGTHIVPDVP